MPLFTVEHDAVALAEAELAAADRIFGLLPQDQARELRMLWDEFEAAQSADAVFAKSLDRFQPPNQVMASGGLGWNNYAVTYEDIETRVGRKVARGAPALWRWLEPRVRQWFDTIR